MHFLIFHTKTRITDASACLCDPNFERTFNVAPEELPSSTWKDVYQYQVLMSLSNFCLMISSKDKLGPFQMYATLMIVFHCITWPSEVSYLVATNGKNRIFISMFLPASELFFAILGVLGCVLMSPD